MKIVYQIDQNNVFVEEIHLEENDPIPTDCIETPMPNGIWLPAKYENGAWSTMLTQDEINTKMGTATPSDTDNLKKQLADLSFTLMVKGVI